MLLHVRGKARSGYLRRAHSVCQVTSGGHIVYARLPQVVTQCMSGYLRWAHSVCQVTSGGHTVYVQVRARGGTCMRGM